MKVLLELLGDVSKLLEGLDDLDDVRPDAQSRLRALLETLRDESERLLATGEGARQARALKREELFQRALEALSRQRLDEAEDILEAAVEKFPEDAEFHNHLGLVAWEREEIEAAAEHYARAMEVSFPDEDVDWFDDRHRPFLRGMEGRALALYKLGRNDEALPLFESLAGANPADYSGCRYLAGEIRHRDGDLAAAIRDYRLVPPEPAVLYNLGLAYFQRGELRDAAGTLIRAFVTNRFIACMLLDRPRHEGSHLPGFLSSESYASEFVDACVDLWQAPGARRFLARCYDHPLVQSHLSQRTEELIGHVLSAGPEVLEEEKELEDEQAFREIGSLVRQVLSQYDS